MWSTFRKQHANDGNNALKEWVWILKMKEGTIYKHIIDPMLSGLRSAAADLIPGQLRIIDIACGTGAMAFELSKNARYVVGIDAAESMIGTAKHTQNKLGIRNTEFIIADAADLNHFNTCEFDVATISLAIHQFDTATGLKILEEMKRIAKEVLIVDYASPLPPNNFKQFIWLIEWIAGGDHYRNFKIYQQFGGISAYLKKLNLQVLKTRSKGKSNFSLVLCK